MIALSLQPKEIEDSFKDLFKAIIYAFVFSHKVDLALLFFKSSSSIRIFVREFVFSWMSWSFFSIFVKLWLKEKNFSLF